MVIGNGNNKMVKEILNMCNVFNIEKKNTNKIIN